LGGLFGYLVLLIIVKWSIDWTGLTSPSLITVFTGLFLFKAPDVPLFNYQTGLQQFLIIVGVLCIPWMLIPKPLILRNRYNKYKKVETHHDEENVEHSELIEHPPAASGSGAVHDEFDFSEVLMHQIIHTIEFVLGAISNTASYLRLWALSLAHSQLSIVFFSLLFINGIQAPLSGVGALIGFGAWILATLGVIMIMESLSSFLHALRLHWVEYQNKFYDGGGYKFNPFSFQRILKRTE